MALIFHFIGIDASIIPDSVILLISNLLHFSAAIEHVQALILKVIVCGKIKSLFFFLLFIYDISNEIIYIFSSFLQNIFGLEFWKGHSRIIEGDLDMFSWERECMDGTNNFMSVERLSVRITCK